MGFACTSGLRADSLRRAATDPESILSDYEDFKRSFKAPGESVATGDLCAQAGLAFIPMVVEAHSGGWAKAARHILHAIASQSSASCNGVAEVESLSIAQR